ncbi:hypothetical protein CR513_06629, partial [Mucuna pruriens]
MGHPTISKESANWRADMLPDLSFVEIIKKEPLVQIGNAILVHDDSNKPNSRIRDESTKTKTLVEIERKIEENGKPWYHDIKRYLEKREYPKGISENDKRMLRRLAFGFFLNGEIMYKMSVDMTLL